MTFARPVSPLKHPLGVTLYFVCHLAAAFVLALPTTSLVTATGVGRFAEGDRVLFQPGGVIAAEVLRALAPALSPHVASSLGVGTLLAVLLLLPHAALLVLLSGSERDPYPRVWGRAVGRFPGLLLLSGLALLAQAIIVVASTTLGGMLRDALRGATTRSADLAYVFVVTLGMMVLLAVGLVRDLARAGAVANSLAPKAALHAGLRALARAPSRVLFGWAAPAATGLALVGVGAVLTAALDVSRTGAWRVALVALLHQAIAYALCWCRAFWLSTSLAVVRTTERSNDQLRPSDAAPASAP